MIKSPPSSRRENHPFSRRTSDSVVVGVLTKAATGTDGRGPAWHDADSAIDLNGALIRLFDPDDVAEENAFSDT